jgi:hypothetical protein
MPQNASLVMRKRIAPVLVQVKRVRAHDARRRALQQLRRDAARQAEREQQQTRHA